MKKSYIIPATEINSCEAFHLLAGSGPTLKAQDHEAIQSTGEEGDMSDFINRTNLWDED